MNTRACAEVIAAALDQHVRALLAPIRKRLQALEAQKGMRYRGIHDASESYAEGDYTTHAGSLWHCNLTGTRQRPGHVTDWQLAVKRGRGG